MGSWRSWLSSLWGWYGGWIRELLGSGSRPRHRPPTRAGQARPWELRGQAVGLNVTPTWQRCPQRHWGREGKDRWRGERVA